MSAYAKAASALVREAINGDPGREWQSWSEDGNLDSRDKASADRMDHACGVYPVSDLSAVDASCLVGGKQQENTGTLHAGAPCSVQCRWLLDDKVTHSRELGEWTMPSLVVSLCSGRQDCSTLWPCFAALDVVELGPA
jgi:hypothetical protein